MKASLTISKNDLTKELKEQLANTAKNPIKEINIKVILEDGTAKDFKELNVEFESE